MTKHESWKLNKKADADYPFQSWKNDDGSITYSVPLEWPEDQTSDEPTVAENQACILLRFPGGGSMRVHFVELTDRNFAYEQCTWLNTQHTRERRYSERYQPLKSPDDEKREDCVWDYSPRMRRNEEGYTLADYSDLPDLIEAAIRDRLPSSDLYRQVYRLSVHGIKPKEIAEILGIAQEMVYFYRKEALRVAQEYRRNYFDEGQYVFPELKARKTKRDHKQTGKGEQAHE